MSADTKTLTNLLSHVGPASAALFLRRKRLARYVRVPKIDQHGRLAFDDYDRLNLDDVVALQKVTRSLPPFLARVRRLLAEVGDVAQAGDER